MNKAPLLLLTLGIMLSACTDTAKVRVENKVHKVSLENVSFGDHYLTYSLLPGEKSERYTITDYYYGFPITRRIKFYMVSGSQRVYLETRQKFTLDAGDDLVITISDSTVVLNPLLEE